MRNEMLTVGQNLVFVLACVLLLTSFVQSQGLSQEDGECSRCWLEMEDAITTAADFLRGDVYRHRDHVNQRDMLSSSRRLSHSLFKRSLDSSSADCDSCWLVLDRIRTFIQNNRDKDSSSLGILVKKGMLNNGWS